jgi:hypothetical protein
MATHIECIECGDVDPPRLSLGRLSLGRLSLGRLSLGRLLKIVAAVAVAAVLMYAETWVIQQDPVLADAYVLQPAGDANSDTDSPFRDTAGPVAVLH